MKFLEATFWIPQSGNAHLFWVNPPWFQVTSWSRLKSWVHRAGFHATWQGRASSKDKWWLTKRYTVYGCIRYIYTPNSCFFYHQVPIFSEYFPHTQMPNFRSFVRFPMVRWGEPPARQDFRSLGSNHEILETCGKNASSNIVNMWGSSFQTSEKVEVFNH